VQHQVLEKTVRAGDQLCVGGWPPGAQV